MFSIDIPMPSLDEKTTAELKKLLREMQKVGEAGPVMGGVSVEGDAAAYALVWEWGNARQTQKGPKTTLGINPDGQQVWLSIQAPFGYIRIGENEYVRILENELAEMDFGDWETAKDVLAEMKRAASHAGQLIAEVIKENAPVDTGELRESIQAMSPDDPDLKSDDPELELGEGFAHAALERTLGRLKI